MAVAGRIGHGNADRGLAGPLATGAAAIVTVLAAHTVSARPMDAVVPTLTEASSELVAGTVAPPVEWMVERSTRSPADPA